MVVGPNNDKYKTNDNGTRLLSLSDENKLFITNSLFPSKAVHRHTWYSPTGFSKRVDYILAEWHLKKALFLLSCLFARQQFLLKRTIVS